MSRNVRPIDPRALDPRFIAAALARAHRLRAQTARALIAAAPRRAVALVAAFVTRARALPRQG